MRADPPPPRFASARSFRLSAFVSALLPNGRSAIDLNISKRDLKLTSTTVSRSLLSDDENGEKTRVLARFRDFPLNDGSISSSPRSSSVQTSRRSRFIFLSAKLAYIFHGTPRRGRILIPVTGHRKLRKR